MTTGFGGLLQERRLAAGLTQEALAERAGLGVRSIQGWERGEHRPLRDALRRLADALALSEEERAHFLAAATPPSPGPRAARRAAGTPPPTLPRHNLPPQLTSFVGRAREIATVRDLLARARLLTLTGSGGVGKTRLALEVAAGVLDRHPDGVWFVDLAPLAEPGRVPGTALGALGAPEQPGCPPLATLQEALRTRRALLVLDNCEHLRDACARLAEALLTTCPHLRILTTSREPLGIAGEARWRVPSLLVPPPDPVSASGVAGVEVYEAVQLFLARARAVQPGLALTPGNAATVADICRRLDGIPLALELAAARLSALGVADLAARLDQRFRLLRGGSPTAAPRLQTLQATVDWSYGLLTPAEQACFNRLSVFTGGFTLEGAEAVAAGEAIAEAEVPDLLARLAEKSLVLAEDREDGRAWYRLLETLRQYGGERLATAGETARVRSHHAAYYRALAARADRELIGPDAPRWFNLLEREHDNLRTALAWSLDEIEERPGGDDAPAGEAGLRLAGDLFWFWLFHDHHAEGLAWLDRALVRGAAPAAVRARASCAAGALAGFVLDLARAQDLLRQGVALGRETGDRRLLSWGLSTLGWALWRGGQAEEATAALEEGLALARGLGEPWPIAYALMHAIFRVANTAAVDRPAERARAGAAGAEALRLYRAVGDRMNAAVMQVHLGRIALYEGDHVRARAMLEASLPVMRALGWRTAVAESLVQLAAVARAQGADGEAIRCYEEAQALYRHLGDHWSPAVAWVLSRLAAIALERGEGTVAQTYVAGSLRLVQGASHDTVPNLADPAEVRAALAAGDPAGVSSLTASALPGLLEIKAALEAARGRPERALRLAGAAAGLRARSNRPLARAEQAALERRLAAARRALGAAEQATVWAEGQALAREPAIAEALDGDTPERGAPPHHPTGPRRTPMAASAEQRLSREERLAWTLEHLRTVGPLSPREYVAALGVERRTAVRDLRALEARGLVASLGATTDRRYVLRRTDP